MNTMNGSHGGWFKMPRACVSDPLIHRDTEHLAVMATLLANAAYEPSRDMFGGECITLLPGQLVTGRSQIAALSKVNESKVQRILKRFEEAGLIRQKAGNKSRLITLAPWLIGQETEQLTNNNRTASEQQMNTFFPCDVVQWQELYPAVDVMQQLRNMYGWCDANPAKRKTMRRIRGAMI